MNESLQSIIRDIKMFRKQRNLLNDAKNNESRIFESLKSKYGLCKELGNREVLEQTMLQWLAEECIKDTAKKESGG
jgi:hypothetical protein